MRLRLSELPADILCDALLICADLNSGRLVPPAGMNFYILPIRRPNGAGPLKLNFLYAQTQAATVHGSRGPIFHATEMRWQFVYMEVPKGVEI